MKKQITSVSPFQTAKVMALSRAFESGKGLSVAEIKVLSGHKSLASLERYANLDVKKVAKKLG